MTLAEDTKTMSTILKISKWIIPFLLTGIISAVTFAGNRIDQRFSVIETSIDKNSTDIAEQKIELKNYNIQIQEMKLDIREIRDNQEKMLIILMKKH